MCQRYTDEILGPIVCPMQVQSVMGSFFMDDNAGPHRAQLVNTMLLEEGIEQMEWAAY